jgi:hypothetical protein
LLGAYWSARLGYASALASYSDAGRLQRASRLAPADAEYAANSGLLTDNVASQTIALRRATVLSPYYSWAWLQLGLLADSQGNVRNAERLLLKAAETDHGFDPRWALLNFYYRNHAADAFWYWAHEAVTTGSSDLSPVFRLAWRLTPDGSVLLSRIAGDDRTIREQLFQFVLREQSAEAAASLADTIAGDAAQVSLNLLMSYCDRLIEGRQSRSAVTIWNALASQKRIVFPPVRLSSPDLINPDFSVPITGRGLDWITEDVSGISFQRDTGNLAGLRIHFSGEQPEGARLLRQRIPVAAGSYRFEWNFESGGKGTPLGLSWRVSFDERDPAGVLAQSSGLSTGGAGALEFAVPTGQEVVSLALLYQRPRGEARLRDDIEITHLRFRRVHG